MDWVYRREENNKTISKDMANECRRRIARFKLLKKEIDNLTREALIVAPWQTESSAAQKIRKKNREIVGN